MAGTSRRFAAVRSFGRDRSEADMPRGSRACRSDENDPQRTLGHPVFRTKLAHHDVLFLQVPGRRPESRFRTIQVCPKDSPVAVRQAGHAVKRTVRQRVEKGGRCRASTFLASTTVRQSTGSRKPLAASSGGQHGHDNTSYNPHRCADSFRWRLVRQGSLVLGLIRRNLAPAMMITSCAAS
jgi:hypothetical protein